MFFDKGVANPECDVHDLQQIGIDTCRDGDIFVEIGTFLGESLHCLIDKAVAQQKSIKLFCVDNFDLEFMNRENGKDFDLDIEVRFELEREKEIVKYGHKGMLVHFFNRLREAGKEKYLSGCLVGRSWDLASTFADNSIHFCFIDAGHSYNAVRLDMQSWHPKMKADGVFCGHDWYAGAGVRQAVIEFAHAKGLKIQTSLSGWRLVRP